MNLEYVDIKEQKTGKSKKFPITESFRNELQEFISGRSPDEWLFSSK